MAIRKSDGFLPGEVIERVTGPDWRGETYGLRMQRHSLTSEDRVVLVDDWTRSGAKIVAARQLIESTGATLVGVSIIVDDLADDARPRLGRFHALLRADAF